MSNFDEYLSYIVSCLQGLRNSSDYRNTYDKIVVTLANCREREGRVFIAGMGGSAANAQHMANDFRKIAGIDAICLSDNIAELTARANDDGLDTIYSNTLKVSNFSWKDILFVLSVSGGNENLQASMALVNAIRYVISKNAFILGIVGMSNSVTSKFGSAVIVTPQPAKYLTQVAESLQSIIWHGIVSDERLLLNKAKW